MGKVMKLKDILIAAAITTAGAAAVFSMGVSGGWFLATTLVTAALFSLAISAAVVGTGAIIIHRPHYFAGFGLGHGHHRRPAVGVAVRHGAAIGVRAPLPAVGPQPIIHGAGVFQSRRPSPPRNYGAVRSNPTNNAGPRCVPSGVRGVRQGY
jgi:hypothetical protein